MDSVSLFPSLFSRVIISPMRKATPLATPATDAVALPSTSLVLTQTARAALDKAIVDKALSAMILEDLPLFYAQLRDIALNPDSPSAPDTLRYLLNRVAGKPTEVHQVQGPDGGAVTFTWLPPQPPPVPQEHAEESL